MIIIEKSVFVECDTCGAKLHANVMETTKDGCVIHIEPCGYCLNEEYLKGYEDAIKSYE